MSKILVRAEILIDIVTRIFTQKIGKMCRQRQAQVMEDTSHRVTKLTLRSDSFGALALVALVLFFFAQAALLQRLRGSDTSWVEPIAQRSFKWNPTFFKTLTFGHVPLAVDLLLIRFLTEDPSYTAVQKGTHPPAYYDLDLASDLDPAFGDLYMAGAGILAVVRSDAEGARDLLIKGERFRKELLPSYPEEFRKRYWGSEWELPYSLAYVQLFELSNLPAAEEAFRAVASIPGSPAVARNIVRRLDKPEGRFEVAFRIISGMFDRAKDPDLKTGYQRKLRSLQLQHWMFRVSQAWRSSRPQGVSGARLEKAWAQFLASQLPSGRDPAGGALSLDSQAEVRTSTEYERVFGLE